MRIVANSKETASNAFMYPRGIDCVEDLPHDLHNAIEHALRILSWQENLPSDEMPPRWMWNLDWELDIHFKKISQERRSKYGLDDSSSEEEPEAVWEDNVYAARFKD